MAKIILAIDPGPEQSAAVIYDPGEAGPVVRHALYANVGLLGYITALPGVDAAKLGHLAIEMICSYGMAVGKTTFDTCVWIGRFLEAFDGPHSLVPRKTRWGPGGDTYGAEGVYDGVAMHLCKNNRAKDSNIKAAICDRFGGDMRAAKGTKKNPGPLYGFKDHLWSALAVAITFAEQREGGDG